LRSFYYNRINRNKKRDLDSRKANSRQVITKTTNKMKNFKDEELEAAWGMLLDYGVANQKELLLVTCINGYNLESLLDVLYARTALNSFEQLKDERN